MRRAFLLALCCLLSAGCITRGSKSPDKGGDPTVPAEQAARTVPGPVQVVGRVIATDLRTLSVMIELAPYAVVPPDFGGRILISDKMTCAPLRAYKRLLTCEAALWEHVYWAGRRKSATKWSSLRAHREPAFASAFPLASPDTQA